MEIEEKNNNSFEKSATFHTFQQSYNKFVYFEQQIAYPYPVYWMIFKHNKTSGLTIPMNKIFHFLNVNLPINEN
jgi:hypothetical protein